MIKGVYENLNGDVDFCPTDHASVRKVVELTIGFVQAHPELKDKDSADIVRWALTDGFPCRQEGVKSSTDGSQKKH
jgi:hypothetical protein